MARTTRSARTTATATPATPATATTEGSAMTDTTATTATATPETATTAPETATTATTGTPATTAPETAPETATTAPETATATTGTPVTLESMQAMLIALAEENAKLSTAVQAAAKPAKKLTPRQVAMTATAATHTAATLPETGTTATLADSTRRGPGGTLHTLVTLDHPWLGGTVLDVAYDRRINQAQVWMDGDCVHVVDGTWSDVDALRVMGLTVAPARIKAPAERNA